MKDDNTDSCYVTLDYNLTPLELAVSVSMALDNGTKVRETTVEYATFNHDEDTLLPFIPQMVQTLTESDGQGNDYVTTYSYAGGRYDPLERDYLGFETVVQTNPDDTTLTVTFHNDFGTEADFYLKSRPESLVFTDASGQTDLISVDYTYSLISGGDPEPWGFYALTRQWTDHYWGADWYAQKEFTWDGVYGNRASATLSGTGGETVGVDYTYTGCAGSLCRPSSKTITGVTGGGSTGQVARTDYDYDVSGNLVEVTLWNDAGADVEISYTRDAFGNATTKTDGRGYTWTYEYDSLNKTYVTEQEKPLAGHVYTWEYDYRFGQPITETDPNLGADGNNAETYYEYDLFGRLVRTWYSHHLRETLVTYHDQANPAYVHTATKRTASDYMDAWAFYDGLGRELQTTSEWPGGLNVTRTVYDEMGRVEYVYGPFFAAGAGDAYPQGLPGTCHWEHNEYDDLGRVSVNTKAGNIVTGFSHDGLAVTMTDPDGYAKTEVSDYLGRLREVVDHYNNHTYYAYTSPGGLIQVTDAGANVTSITLDSLGRKTAMTDPDMGSWTYGYDANGNLTSQVDARGITTTLAYDALNRVTSKSFSNGDPTHLCLRPDRTKQLRHWPAVARAAGRQHEPGLPDRVQPAGRAKNLSAPHPWLGPPGHQQYQQRHRL